MTNRDWAVLGFQLFGLWLASRLIEEIVYRVAIGRMEGADVAFMLAFAFMAMFLWMRSDWLASRTFRHAPTSEAPNDGGSAELLLVTALSIMGIYVIASAVPDIAAGGIVLANLPAYRSVLGNAFPTEPTVQALAVIKKADLIAEVLRLLIGVVLLVYSGRIAPALVAVRRERDLTDSFADGDQEPEKYDSGSK